MLPRRARTHRPSRAHGRRAAAVEFLALAGELRRACVYADAVAGFHARGACAYSERFPPQTAPLRRSLSYGAVALTVALNFKILICRIAYDAVNFKI